MLSFTFNFNYQAATNTFVNMYKQQYQWGWITKDTLRNYVAVQKVITPEQYQEIVGEPYEESGVQSKA